MGRGGLVFGSDCNPGTLSLIGLPKWPPCPGYCLAQRSNLAFGHGPELRIPAPLRCGEGKGHSEPCGRRWLHAHENQNNLHFSHIVNKYRSLFSLLVPPSHGSLFHPTSWLRPPPSRASSYTLPLCSDRLILLVPVPARLAHPILCGSFHPTS